LDEFRCQAPRLIHVLGPAAQLFEVLIDARLGGTEFVLCSAPV
jgi:hypothetical protein